jgi:hypothetical protein
MMLLGLGISLFAPEIGAPLALTGLLLETCAYAGVPGCIAVKTISLNLSITVDSYGNLYAGPQISIGKSLLPLISFSNNMGAIYSHDQQPPTEAQVRDHLTGFSLSAGTLATGGINYSPLASDIKTSFYTVGLPELASANINLYNFRLFDFIQ